MRKLERPGRHELVAASSPAESPTVVQELDDKELTLAFKRGERGAYQRIYDRYSPRVHGVCRRMLTKPEDAEEAAQESFLRVYQALGRFNGRYLLGPWITRITTNVCLDHIRAKSRRPVDPVPAELIELQGDLGHDDLDPEHLHLKVAEGRRVRRLLDSLPPMYRAAIVLRDFEGLSYADVAAVLEITEPQTKALIHRARQAFKRSWSSALVAAPLRLLNRLRRVNPAGREQGGQVASVAQQTTDSMSSAAQVVSQCSAALQQCGHVFAERAAGIAAVAVIGTAGAAIATHAAATPAAPVPAKLVTAAPVARHAVGHSRRHVAPPRGRRPDADAKAPAPAPTPADTAPPPSDDTAGDGGAGPAPQPTETAAPPPSDPPGQPAPASGGTDPSASPTPTPPAEPAGFTFSFETGTAPGDAPCACAGPTTVESSWVASTSAGIERLDQTLSGTALAQGQARYGVWLRQQSSSGSDHRIEFRLYTPDGGYFYEGSGTVVARSVTDWGGWSYTYSGTYHVTSRPAADDAMPQSGSYTVTIDASWQHNRIVSSAFSLTQR